MISWTLQHLPKHGKASRNTKITFIFVDYWKRNDASKEKLDTELFISCLYKPYIRILYVRIGSFIIAYWKAYLISVFRIAMPMGQLEGTRCIQRLIKKAGLTNVLRHISTGFIKVFIRIIINDREVLLSTFTSDIVLLIIDFRPPESNLCGTKFLRCSALFKWTMI